MTVPLGQAVRDAAREQIRRELAVRLTAAHGAVLRRVPDLYRRIIGEALLAEDGQTGKAAQMRAAQRALDRVARIGVADFVDQSGRRWNMQSYVEMAVRTAALRAMVTAQTRVYRDRGIGLVRVSDHAGGCPLCAPFEGRLLALDTIPDEPVRDGSGRRVEVVATVAEAIAAGLHHPNCRHTLAPFIPGVSVLPPPQPHDPDEYLAQQRLRALERQVRAWRRREAAAITPEARDLARRKVADWQAAIRAHVAATGTRRLRGREQPVRALPSPTPRRTPPVRTYTPAELADDYRRRVGDIPAVERRALSNYAGGEFVGMNDFLRHGESWANKWAAEPVAALERLARRYTLPADVTAWRRVRAVPGTVNVGAVFEDRGFTSASLAEQTTVEFRDHPVALQIRVPAGSNGIVVNGIGNGVAAENELILPPRTRFRVETDEMREGRRWLTVTALSPPSS